MSQEWVYPPAWQRPDRTKPARLIYDKERNQLLIEFYDIAGNLYRLPLALIALPAEFQELRAALGLTDLFPIVKLEHVSASGNVKVSHEEARIKVPADIQDHWQANVVLLASAARTASGSAGDVDVGPYSFASVCLDVTAVSGTSPVLNVYVEGKNVYANKYFPVVSWANISAVTFDCKPLDRIPWKYMRVRWGISGTSPSFTFSVSMEAKS